MGEFNNVNNNPIFAIQKWIAFFKTLKNREKFRIVELQVKVEQFCQFKMEDEANTKTYLIIGYPPKSAKAGQKWDFPIS